MFAVSIVRLFRREEFGGFWQITVKLCKRILVDDVKFSSLTDVVPDFLNLSSIM